MCDRFFVRTICLFLLIGPYFSQAGQHPGEFAASITSHVQMQYLLFTPEGYEQAEGKIWPLIVYLHGGSRRGENIERLREPGYGLPAMVEKNKSFPFIVLSPLCPEGEYWTEYGGCCRSSRRGYEQIRCRREQSLPNGP